MFSESYIDDGGVNIPFLIFFEGLLSVYVQLKFMGNIVSLAAPSAGTALLSNNLSGAHFDVQASA